MAVTSNRFINIALSGDLSGNYRFSADENVASEGGSNTYSLDEGDNTITVPAGGALVTAATIIPPEDNEVAITLKGDAADVGILLHLTDPTSIAIDSTVETFVLSVDSEDDTGLEGLRIIWS